MALSRPGSGRTALFILGAPGAGAPALARVLEAAGAAPVADPPAVAALNDRRLAAMGSGRMDPFGPRRRPDGRDAPPEDDVAQARELLRTAEPHEPLLVLADPACTRLHDLWTAALEAEGWRPGFIVVVRPPGETAAELRTHEGLTPNGGLLLWTSHMLDAERAARGGRRVTVALDRLMADPEAELDRIEGGLGLRLPRRTWDSAAEIEALVRDGARPTPSAVLPETLAPLRAFAEHLMAAAADEPGNADVAAETARWFSSLTELMVPVMRRVRPGPVGEGAPTPTPERPGPDPAALDAAREEARGAAGRAEAAEAQVAILQGALAVSRRRATEAEALLQSRATQASAGERDARAALAAALSAREALEGELDAAFRERDALLRERDEAQRGREGAQEALAEARRQQGAAREAQERERRERDDARRERDQAWREKDEARRERDEAQRGREGAQEALAEARRQRGAAREAQERERREGDDARRERDEAVRERDQAWRDKDEARRERDEAQHGREGAQEALAEARRELEKVALRSAHEEALHQLTQSRLQAAEADGERLEAEVEDERTRHDDARDRLAFMAVANHGAQTRVRELEARLADLREAQERRRRWLPRLFGLR